MNGNTDALIAEFDSLVPPPLPLSRRGFLVTALGAGFALAVQPVRRRRRTAGSGCTRGSRSMGFEEG